MQVTFEPDTPNIFKIFKEKYIRDLFLKKCRISLYFPFLSVQLETHQSGICFGRILPYEKLFLWSLLRLQSDCKA
jgi:hypothetical protein